MYKLTFPTKAGYEKKIDDLPKFQSFHHVDTPKAGCTIREAIDIVVWPNMANSRVVRPHQKWRGGRGAFIQQFDIKTGPPQTAQYLSWFLISTISLIHGPTTLFYSSSEPRRRPQKKFRHLGFCVDVQLVVDFITWSVVAIRGIKDPLVGICFLFLHNLKILFS